MLLIFLIHPIFSDPFGINPALSEDYHAAINQDRNSFTCLDQSITIPLSSLNDGKCDCPDGSDEPGTNACLNGHFYCQNKGGKPKLIPSHKVNDGICDCCDGSDEINNINHQCPNVCSQLVNMSYLSRNLIYSKIRAGIKIREEIIKETQLDYQNARKEMRDLHQEVAKLEHELDVLNRKKREKYKIYKIEKRQKDGISEEQHAEYKQRKKEYIFKPPKKKQVHTEPDPYGLNVPFNKNLTDNDWDVYEEIEGLIFHSTPLPSPIRSSDYYSQFIGDNEIDQNRIYKRTKKWNEMQAQIKKNQLNTTKTLSFIRKIKDLISHIFKMDQLKSYNQLKEVENEIKGINDIISELKIAVYKLEKKFKYDLGEDNVWWSIAGKSFELSKDGNDYQLIIFEHLMQRQTGSIWFGNSYGSFHGFNDSNRTMLYEEGQLCWEGPPRRTEVLLYCGSINKFIDIEEIDRCVYRAHFETPLCCNEDYIHWIKNMSDLNLSDYISQWMEVE